MSDPERAYWERQARRYDRSMLLLGRPLPRMRVLCAEAVNDGDRVLEVAAGTGLVTLALAAKAQAVVATDYAEAMMALLRHRIAAAGVSNVTCQQADLTALPYPDAAFDVVVASNVLHLVPDLPVALASLRRVLRPGGRLLAPTFCHDETWTSRCLSSLLALTGFPGHRRFTLASLKSVLEGEGLQVLRTEAIPGPLPIGFIEAVR